MATDPTGRPTSPQSRRAERACRKRPAGISWMHFTRMGAYDAGHEIPIIVARRGVLRLRRARQALSGRPLGAVLRQRRPRPRGARRGCRAARSKELGFFTNWSYAHPKAIELAARIADAAPGDLNRVFFTSGGSEAVESALEAGAPVPQAHRQRRCKHKIIARETRLPRHHLRRALDHRHHPLCAASSSRWCRAPTTCPTRTSTAGPRSRDPALGGRRRSSEVIEFEGPETVAAVILEPVQNSGGCFVPPGRLLAARARDLRPATTCC